MLDRQLLRRQSMVQVELSTEVQKHTVIVRPSRGSHERHGGAGVDAEETHVDRVCCWEGVVEKGRKVVFRKKRSGSVARRKARGGSLEIRTREGRIRNIASE